MASELKSVKVAAIAIIALIIGVVIGYGVSLALVPAPEVVVEKPVPKLTGKIPIGALLPLTGELATYGENSKLALELAAKEINDWLAAKGAEWQLELVIEDSATDPKVAADKIAVLHGKGIKVIIGPMSSAEVSEIKTYADTNEILIISQSSTSPALSIPGDFIYRYCPDDTIQGPAAARILFELGARWVFPVWRGDTWGDGVKVETEEAFMNILKAAGEEGGFVKGIRYAPGTKEFSAEAATMNDVLTDLVAKYGADKVAVLYIGFEEAAAFVLAARKYDVAWQVTWVGSDGTAGLAPLVEEPEAAEFSFKVKWVHPIFSVTVNPRYEKVTKYIRDKVGRTPDAYAYAAYDALWTVALAIDFLDEYDARKIRAIIPSILEWYFGASGNFALNENGDRAFADYEIMMVKEVAPGKYEWAKAGVWRGAIDTVEWEQWFVEL